jgi:hypothetical protein
MKVLKIQIELEDEIARTYQKAPQSVQAELREGVAQWLQQTLHRLHSEAATDPWMDFLSHIQEYAVDTGIEDLSLNHEHYLYGGPKRA